MIGEIKFIIIIAKVSTSENNTTLLVGPKILNLNLNRGKGLQFN